MKKKTVKKLSDIVAESLYQHCCTGKKCENCKYDRPKFHCHISKIIKIVQEYEEEYIIYEKNNKNQ